MIQGTCYPGMSLCPLPDIPGGTCVLTEDVARWSGIPSEGRWPGTWMPCHSFIHSQTFMDICSRPTTVWALGTLR